MNECQPGPVYLACATDEGRAKGQTTMAPILPPCTMPAAFTVPALPVPAIDECVDASRTWHWRIAEAHREAATIAPRRK